MSVSDQTREDDGPRYRLDDLVQTTGRRIASTRQVSNRALQLLDGACLRLDRALLVLAASRRLAAGREADARRTRGGRDHAATDAG